MGRILKYKCPFCSSDKTFERTKLVRHVSSKHEKELPEGFTPLRYVFNYVNKKPVYYHGICVICKKETPWDENKGRYDRLCGRPECKKQYIDNFEKNMKRTRGYKRLSSTPEGLEKMLNSRKISGKYRFSDGTEKTYTGSYEFKALKFMDKILNIKSEDLHSPGPVMEYKYQGKIHLYIPDFYYEPYDLIIEVKDGGDNPNRKSMIETRAKQVAKEKHIIENTKYNYLRLTNNDFSQLLNVFMSLKMKMVDNSAERVIHVNENMTPGEIGNGVVRGINDTSDCTYVVQYKQNNVFNDDEDKLGITNSPLIESIITRNGEGKLTLFDENYTRLKIGEYKLYKTSISLNECCKRLAPYMGEFVTEDFIYETLFNKKIYTYDQIQFEAGVTEDKNFIDTLNTLQENFKNYLLHGKENING